MAATRRAVRSGRAMTVRCRAVRAFLHFSAPEAIVRLARAPRARQDITRQTPVAGVVICHIRRAPGHAMRYHRDRPARPGCSGRLAEGHSQQEPAAPRTAGAPGRR